MIYFIHGIFSVLLPHAMQKIAAFILGLIIFVGYLFVLKKHRLPWYAHFGVFIMLSVALSSLLLLLFSAINEGQIQSLSGEWIYAAPSRYNGIDRVALRLSVEENGTVQGNFDAVLEPHDSLTAAYIDTGIVIGTADGNILNLQWTGDRHDHGTATVSYDSTRSILTWIAAVEQDDGIFTIPLKMDLIHNNTESISNIDRSAISGLILQEAAHTMGIPQDALRVEIDMYTGGYARINIQPAQSVTDPSFWYVELSSGKWRPARDHNVPTTLLYY